MINYTKGYQVACPHCGYSGNFERLPSKALSYFLNDLDWTERCPSCNKYLKEFGGVIAGNFIWSTLCTAKQLSYLKLLGYYNANEMIEFKRGAF